MKKTIYLFAAVSALAFSACSSDDDDNNTQSGLNGRWHLVKIQSPWSATDNSFGRGTIKWTFNENNGKLVVVNDAILPEDLNNTSGPPSGTYDYTVGAWEQMCDEALSIDEQNYGCISYVGDTLKISTSEVDGPIYKLVR